jgi:hypothetical protein
MTFVGIRSLLTVLYVLHDREMILEPNIEVQFSTTMLNKSESLSSQNLQRKKLNCTQIRLSHRLCLQRHSILLRPIIKSTIRTIQVKATAELWLDPNFRNLKLYSEKN